MKIVIRDLYQDDLPGGVLTRAANNTYGAFYYPIRNQIIPVCHFEYDDFPSVKRGSR